MSLVHLKVDLSANSAKQVNRVITYTGNILSPFSLIPFFFFRSSNLKERGTVTYVLEHRPQSTRLIELLLMIDITQDRLYFHVINQLA